MSWILTMAAVLLAAAAWLLKQHAAHALARVERRRGNVGWVKGRCGFFAVADSDGSKVLFDPNHMFLDQDPLYLTVEGDLFNGTDTPVVLVEHSIWLMHPDGDHTEFRKPRTQVEGKPAVTVALPAHDRRAVTFTLTMFRSDLSTIYAHTLPVLKAVEASGTKYSFRLSGVSFHGRPPAFWPRNGDLPVRRSSGKDDARAAS